VTILFLHPLEATERMPWYLAAAESLARDHGCRVVFVYTARQGGVKSNLVDVFWFEEWARANDARIRAQDPWELEQRFGLTNLYLAAVAERRFSDYSFLGHGHWCRRLPIERLEYYVKAATLFYEEIVRRYGVEVAVAHAPDNLHSALLYLMAPDLNFHAVGLYRDVYWDPRSHYLLDDGHYRSDLLRLRYQAFRSQWDEFVAPVVEECAEFIRKRASGDPMKHTSLLKNRGVMEILGGAASAFVGRRKRFSLARPDILDAMHTRDPVDATICTLTRVANRLRAGVPGVRDLAGTGRYVFFPLHLQPEATVLVSAPVYGNQLAVVQAVSASLPMGYRLVVKDHPIIGGRRSPSFYRDIQALPNVVLAKENVSGVDIVNQCDAVVTIKGTAGFDAVLRGKPVLTLAPVWYEDAPLVTQVHDLQTLPLVLKRVLLSRVDPEAHRRDLLAFVAAFRSIMFRDDDYESSDPERKGRGMARLLMQMLAARDAAVKGS